MLSNTISYKCSTTCFLIYIAHVRSSFCSIMLTSIHIADVRSSFCDSSILLKAMLIWENQLGTAVTKVILMISSTHWHLEAPRNITLV